MHDALSVNIVQQLSGGFAGGHYLFRLETDNGSAQSRELLLLK
jgi:hypothetical protein